MKLNEIKIYRMTHIENILHILNNGITHRSSKHANSQYKPIGDISLTDYRKDKKIKVDNGEGKNIEKILLGDFIPFYFGIKMPMLYVIQKGGNFVEKAMDPENIVYLACALDKIILMNTRYYFTDGHATDNLTTFYNETKIEELPNIIDWEAVKSKYWGGHEDLNMKRKKQAEFLIADDIPVRFLLGIACYNKTAKKRLINMGVEADKIRIFPKAYF